jgi:hypothetical protein
MCVSCGCNKPNDNHGDIRHITMNQLEQAAAAANMSAADVAKNIQKAATQQS